MYEINSEDRKDIQGLLIYGYAQLRSAYFIVFKIEDVAKFKTWLATTTFHDSEKSPQGSCMNIAFTATGLKQLVDKHVLHSIRASLIRIDRRNTEECR